MSLLCHCHLDILGFSLRIYFLLRVNWNSHEGMSPQQGKAFGVQVQLFDVKHTLKQDGLVMNLKWRLQNPLTQPSRTVQQRGGLAVGFDPPLESQLRGCPVRTEQAFNWCHQRHGMPGLIESNHVKLIINFFSCICNKHCIENFGH